MLALPTPASLSEPRCSENRGMRLGAEKAESLDCTAIVQTAERNASPARRGRWLRFDINHA
jgi:hypothetical protein